MNASCAGDGAMGGGAVADGGDGIEESLHELALGGDELVDDLVPPVERAGPVVRRESFFGPRDRRR